MRNQINTETEQAILQGSDGEVVILQKVEIEGRADDLLFKVKLRQHYRNDTKKILKPSIPFHSRGVQRYWACLHTSPAKLGKAS